MAQSNQMTPNNNHNLKIKTEIQLNNLLKSKNKKNN